MKNTVENFVPQGGKHCITNSLKQIFTYYGYPMSEELMFGLASGLSFLLGIGFSLITLREPVYFDPKDDPVEVMICFSAIDSQTHLDILKMIVTFVEKGYVEKIAKLDTIDELNALLQNEE